MALQIANIYISAATWVNQNQGVVGVGIFGLTLLLGWLASLRRRPKFKLDPIDGPTFICTYLIGKKHGKYECHRTGITLYLKVSNVGSAASTVERVSVAYHWSLRPFSLLWLRHSVGWLWIRKQAVSLEDFQVSIGNSVKSVPLLDSDQLLVSDGTKTDLEIGHSTNGVVYFEQQDSYGGCFPSVDRQGYIRIKGADKRCLRAAARKAISCSFSDVGRSQEVRTRVRQDPLRVARRGTAL